MSEFPVLALGRGGDWPEGGDCPDGYCELCGSCPREEPDA